MNKYQEALERLRILERAKNLRYQNQVAPQVDCDVLQELVDRATSKKPMPSKRKINYIPVYKCPNCNDEFSGKGLSKHCYHCGQAFDWSEEYGNQ